uniref:Uncharacterized protein n=1 Tax=Caulerpa lentillifera TaxID=148947 RepID=A0A2Z2QKH0_9CHLO|nr:hypothetical protein [Caulerpa lentillifera]AST24233.1 hypothetical protein [Caulerpa lentillifera]QKS32232.1 hypothetical protein [Caulerpa lentillifera]
MVLPFSNTGFCVGATLRFLLLDKPKTLNKELGLKLCKQKAPCASPHNLLFFHMRHTIYGRSAPLTRPTKGDVVFKVQSNKLYIPSTIMYQIVRMLYGLNCLQRTLYAYQAVVPRELAKAELGRLTSTFSSELFSAFGAPTGQRKAKNWKGGNDSERTSTYVKAKYVLACYNILGLKLSLGQRLSQAPSGHNYEMAYKCMMVLIIVTTQHMRTAR